MSDNNDQNRWHQRPWGNPGFRLADHRRRVEFGQRGFLRPEIIQLLEQQPLSGVDIMNKMQEMSHGWYRPSPGSIYPLLEQLEREGMIAKNKDGKFALTAAYREGAGGTSDAVIALESNVSYLEDLRSGGRASLIEYRDRLDKLARRLDALRDAPKPGGSP